MTFIEQITGENLLVNIHTMASIAKSGMNGNWYIKTEECLLNSFFRIRTTLFAYKGIR